MKSINVAKKIAHNKDTSISKIYIDELGELHNKCCSVLTETDQKNKYVNTEKQWAWNPKGTLTRDKDILGEVLPGVVALCLLCASGGAGSDTGLSI